MENTPLVISHMERMGSKKLGHEVRYLVAQGTKLYNFVMDVLQVGGLGRLEGNILKINKHEWKNLESAFKNEGCCVLEIGSNTYGIK